MYAVLMRCEVTVYMDTVYMDAVPMQCWVTGYMYAVPMVWSDSVHVCSSHGVG
ncbi:hypothetical protein ACRRTK_014071 [Alexandromys fortis]